MAIPVLGEPFATSEEKVPVRLADSKPVGARGVVVLRPEDLVVEDGELLIPRPGGTQVIAALPVPQFSLRMGRRLTARHHWPLRWAVPVPENFVDYLGGRREIEILNLVAAVSVDLGLRDPSFELEGSASLLEISRLHGSRPLR